MLVTHTLNVLSRISDCRKELVAVAKYCGLKSHDFRIFFDVNHSKSTPNYFFFSWIKNSFLLNLKTLFLLFVIPFQVNDPFLLSFMKSFENQKVILNVSVGEEQEY